MFGLEILERKTIAFFDIEADPKSGRINDMGAVKKDGREKIHSSVPSDLVRFLQGNKYIGGHNIVHHDNKFAGEIIRQSGALGLIDTLYLSPLLFPQKPYHHLVKDYKLVTDSLNDPSEDALRSWELFCDEKEAFQKLSENKKCIYYSLLKDQDEFKAFFSYVRYERKASDLKELILKEFKGEICSNAPVFSLSNKYPIEMAYCLASISASDRESILPYWVEKQFPQAEYLMHALRGSCCKEKCEYCRKTFDIIKQLKDKYGYPGFRSYDGEPLQEKAVQAGVEGKSLLAVFPTGGGKSITFQLPALIAAEAEKGLTVVISPLQSLMKDQVDNLCEKGIADAVTINGLLNTVERAEAMERVQNGIASLLYISPESLRQRSMEHLLMGRNVVRFVIDEAHCFSSWGQDFRVDYLYIGDFIKKLEEKKGGRVIPVSCFTATAKQKVISDINEYFIQKLGRPLEFFTTGAARKNLRYEVILRNDENEKYQTLRNLIESKNCPTIVYVSRTKKAVNLAEHLTKDGILARPFHGKMEKTEKIKNQDDFIHGAIQVVVATSAFGMGVDKKDVKLVIHYNISDSLENYVQEAGRAGRDENLEAECYVLFNESDLDSHFLLLNQTKLSMNEIQQIWRGIKYLSKGRKYIRCSGLELARAAGWDDQNQDMETKVRTAVTALEEAGYVKRGNNCPRIYADSIRCNSAREANEKIRSSSLFTEEQKNQAVRIAAKIIAARSRSRAGNEEAESRVDYIADVLGMEKEDVINNIELMRQAGILANDKEMKVFIAPSERKKRKTQMDLFFTIEDLLLPLLASEKRRYSYKELNEICLEHQIRQSTVSKIRLFIYFWVIKGYLRKPEGKTADGLMAEAAISLEEINKKREKRRSLCEVIVPYLEEQAVKDGVPVSEEKEEQEYSFSLMQLMSLYEETPSLFGKQTADLFEVQEALLFLEKTGVLRLEGGFLVVYNAMEITRVEMNNKIQYKREDYKKLEEYYQNKMQQIHIVGEYANMMVRDYEAALAFVKDYFQMDYKLFLTKYFKGQRAQEINRGITAEKYDKLFHELSERQSKIIQDDQSKYIVAAAGPGSGKTKILVHKLASLILLEDVKYDQLLMLTFSRAAAMEFRARLRELIGKPANIIDIKTFHSYCFDLLGKVGTIEKSESVVKDAVEMIKSGQVEQNRITKTVLVIDEAQDMSEPEYELVHALIEQNEGIRVIAVGDDDQNIYAFRKSDSKYMASFLEEENSKKYELVQNFRSRKNIVSFSNRFAKEIKNRMKNEDTVPVSLEEGKVWLVSAKGNTVASAIHILENTWKEEEGKTAALLTMTNEDAYLAAARLRETGQKVYLLQGNNTFSLINLYEMRRFLELLKENGAESIVPDEIWDRTINQLKEEFAAEKEKKDWEEILETFRKNTEKIYLSDFESFLWEVKMGDFSSCSKNEIFVSTIFKAKGKEFDKVYLAFGTECFLDDDKKRVGYVGMTRAKEELYISYQIPEAASFWERFRECKGKDIEIMTDKSVLPPFDKIILPMTMRDINLDSIQKEEIQKRIMSYRSGNELKPYLKKWNSGSDSLSFNSSFQASKAFTKKILNWREKGYEISNAVLRYLVYWADITGTEETGEEKMGKREYLVPLPEIWLKRKNDENR